MSRYPGFRDKENDGPVTDEKLTGEFNGDVVWRFDMIEEVGSLPHNLANSSPVSHGDLIYVSTSNGQDESTSTFPRQSRRRLSPLIRKLEKLVWEDKLRFRQDSARSVVFTNSGNDRRRGPGYSRPGRRLDTRL